MLNAQKLSLAFTLVYQSKTHPDAKSSQRQLLCFIRKTVQKAAELLFFSSRSLCLAIYKDLCSYSYFYMRIPLTEGKICVEIQKNLLK